MLKNTDDLFKWMGSGWISEPSELRAQYGNFRVILEYFFITKVLGLRGSPLMLEHIHIGVLLKILNVVQIDKG